MIPLSCALRDHINTPYHNITHPLTSYYPPLNAPPRPRPT